MSEELVAPVAETQTAATEPAETTAVAEPNPTEGAEPTEAKPEKTAEQRELEYLRRKATKAERNNARLYSESEQLRQRLQEFERSKPEAETVEVKPDEIEKAVTTRAQAIARAERLNDKCNAVVEKGSKDFPDFTATVARVGVDLPLFERSGAPTAALDVILEADNPAALLHYLGKNPEVASELSDLSPTQLARRLDRIERDMKPTRQVSNAPRPLEPVRPAAAPSEPDPEKDPEAWMAWRNKHAKR